MTVGAVAVRVGLSAWLVYLAVMDVRKGEVTNWVTVPPLLAVTAWQALTGGWPLALMLALILIGAQWTPLTVPSVGLMAACSWLATLVGQEVVMWAWTFVYVLWLLRVIGGADAKVVMALMALFPDGRLAWLLLLCWFGLSVVYLLRRHGRHAPRALLKATSGLVRFQVAEEEGSRYPALPAVALAGLLYVWFYLGSL
jgi:Flp pilus assembly protein protease CpaA